MKLKQAKKTKPGSHERTADKSLAISPVEYGELQQAYDQFDRELFAGNLPDVFITYHDMHIRWVATPAVTSSLGSMSYR